MGKFFGRGRLKLSSFRSSSFSSKLGPELQANWDMSQGLTGWTAAGVTMQAVTDSGEDAVLLTAVDGVGDRGHLFISGLEIGKTYRCAVKTRRGAQGTEQDIRNFTWGTIPQTPVDTSTYKIYEFDIVATATDGASRLYAATGGAVGDEIYVSEVSIREIL